MSEPDGYIPRLLQVVENRGADAADCRLRFDGGESSYVPWRKATSSLIGSDTIHPNDAGQVAIAEIAMAKLDPTGGNQAPVITSAVADPSDGDAPLTVNFTGAASDPENDPLTFQWDFTSDGVWDATGTNASHVYTIPAYYVCTLRVSDAFNSVEETTVTIDVNIPVLAAPTELTADAVSESRIDLSWHDNSSDETGFVIERSEGVPGTLSVTITGLRRVLYRSERGGKRRGGQFPGRSETGQRPRDDMDRRSRPNSTVRRDCSARGTTRTTRITATSIR